MAGRFTLGEQMAGTSNDLLKATSRSFYLSLRVLPAAVRPQIGLAYLLARTTDTIADTELVSVQGRLEALEALRRRILGATSDALDFGRLAQGCALPAERILLERAEEALRLLDQLPEADRRLVREVLRVIMSGQELDLKRFAEARAASMAALETEAELDDYTYRVAGCVGEFWTRICRLHLFPDARLDEGFLLRNGVRFGTRRPTAQWVRSARAAGSSSQSPALPAPLPPRSPSCPRYPADQPAISRSIDAHQPRASAAPSR